MKYLRHLITALICCTCLSANGMLGCKDPRWSMMFYYGRTTMDTLGQVVGLNFTVDQEELYSFEGSYVFPKDSMVVNYFGPIFSVLEVAGNITIHKDTLGTIYEVIPYFRAGFNRFPWNHFIYTSIAVGEGLSFISKVPYREHRNSDDPKKLLNYLMFEIALAYPPHPEYQLVIRVHHRSGVFGLYNANNSGSTAVGVGIRIYFDNIHYK